MIRRGHRKTRRETELRLKDLERRAFHMEDWTGCHTDEALPDAGDPTVKETLAAQEKVIRHLLRLLDFLVPDFSIARFREALTMVDEAGVDPLPSGWTPEFAEGMEKVIERLIPVPLPRGHRQRQPGTFRPTLVPKPPGPDRDD